MTEGRTEGKTEGRSHRQGSFIGAFPLVTRITNKCISKYSLTPFLKLKIKMCDGREDATTDRAHFIGGFGGRMVGCLPFTVYPLLLRHPLEDRRCMYFSSRQMRGTK